MNSLKAFIKKNKLLVSVTGVITMCTFMIFSIIAFAIGGTGSQPTTTPEATTTTSTNLVVDNNTTETPGDISTPPLYTGEDVTAGEETTPGKTEEPTTTKKPIDPDTLPYEIRVNRVSNFLTVYKKDENGKFTVPYKAITVSCGKNLEDTPLGTYQTIEHYKWRKMNDGTYAQYAYRIVGPILFHSVPYYTQAKNDLEWEEYNKLGSRASMGCVRMTVEDAKWLMDNCPIGTRVTIYDDVNEVPPLGKPDRIKIPANLAEVLNITEEEAAELKKWDPTDPEPANPWHQRYATITYPTQIMVKEGASIETLREFFKATDTCGNDISHKISFDGQFDLNVAGTYDLVVSAVDAIGNKAEITTKLYVQPNSTEPSSEPESPTPSESTTPNESDTPDESTTPNESNTPDESTTPNESNTPDESTTPNESNTPDETTTPNETTTPEESTTPASSTKPTKPSEELSSKESEENTSTTKKNEANKEQETTSKKNNEKPKRNNH